MFAASKTASGSSIVANYIEEVFSAYAYAGTTTGITITNGIDLSGKGGLVWCKSRGSSSYNHRLFDTVNGVNKFLASDNTGALSSGTSLTAFNSNGFTLAASDGLSYIAPYGSPYISWTFRKQPKFFDVVTWTGNGVVGRSITHSLGVIPYVVIVKRTDTTGNWVVYHTDASGLGFLNTTDAFSTANGNSGYAYGLSTTAIFADSMTSDVSAVNASGGTYVAYLFASNAGGFGLAGTDNVISCGSFTTDGSGTATVNLGYEPQWVLLKSSTSVVSWVVLDTMRGWVNGSGASFKSMTLQPNSSAAEAAGTIGGDNLGSPTATGFTVQGVNASDTMIYIAIRRGPMKVPTTGTSVFGMSARSGTGANATVTGGQTDDAVLVKNRGSAVGSLFASRLTGTGYVETSASTAEVAAGVTILQANPWDVMDGVKVGTTSTITNATSNTYINYLFKRAPSYMDVVCYTGTGANTTVTHNLGVAPELWIVKGRSGATAWQIGSTSLANTEYVVLNTTAAKATGATRWNSTYPTSSVFSLGTATETNTSAATYVAYLFATLAGVSKVGTYTGNSSTQTIDCGLTAGARFVLIKRINNAGSWFVWDTARGMTTLTDPYWLTNSSGAEGATLGAVTTVATGFAVNDAILTGINTTGGTYIFLAIA